jgi:CDP-paratose 2-epimerase
VVLHLAAQVAVTTSVTDPRTDFEINALGTFNVCEAVRQAAPDALLLNASTNKVYGHMPEVEVVQRGRCYAYADLPHGVPESQPLDFHSPYGCSKGTADQYVRDYARIYGLRTVNFRQSCIYGMRQFGVEDQGWVAWFTIAATLGRPITIYGDGRQVRDILYVEDLVDCYRRAVDNVERAQGECYNVGGGPRNVLSLLELIGYLEELLGREIPVSYADWRPGDQRVFVADVRKAQRDLGWCPATSKYDGIRRLAEWVGANRGLFQDA